MCQERYWNRSNTSIVVVWYGQCILCTMLATANPAALTCVSSIFTVVKYYYELNTLECTNVVVLFKKVLELNYDPNDNILEYLLEMVPY